MQVTLKCASALLAGMLAVSAAASDLRWPSPPASVEIFDRTEGRVLPTYTYAGKRYVVGKPGNEYAIRVRNNGTGRVLAVMSVDGVNVITGDTAAPLQSGYVLSPYASYDVAGWRKSLSNTAAFYFTALPDSYAARTGRPDNVGVIGVALFRERTRVPQAVPYGGMMRKEAERAEAANAPGPAAADTYANATSPSPAPASAQAKAMSPPIPQESAQTRLGTGHGRSEDSRTEYTEFARANNTPDETIAIYYDSYQNLLAQGVPVAGPPLAHLQPDPFPDRGRFAPDPR
jgi:hypothetical protein